MATSLALLAAAWLLTVPAVLVAARVADALAARRRARRDADGIAAVHLHRRRPARVEHVVALRAAPRNALVTVAGDAAGRAA